MADDRSKASAAVKTGTTEKNAAGAQSAETPIAYPPETLEGWYAVHQVFRIDRGSLRSLPGAERQSMGASAIGAMEGVLAPTAADEAPAAYGRWATVELSGPDPRGRAPRAVASDPQGETGDAKSDAKTDAKNDATSDAADGATGTRPRRRTPAAPVVADAEGDPRISEAPRADGLAPGAGGPASGRPGWSVVVELAGSVGDVMVVHFRPTLEAVGAAQRRLAREPLFDHFEPVTSFLSVTEAGLYHLSAAVAAERIAAGGAAGDAEYRKVMAERTVAERSNPMVQRRLYPPLPADMPYVSFYPMSKRRAVGQNWYALTLAERSRLMQAHGMTGRRYAGKVQQVITGAIGLDAWEWGVTLFARDPMEIKRLVTDMRFDEVSAQYAEFGDFYVGRIVAPKEWVPALIDRRGDRRTRK
jgi:hydrogen peroxide-dependent heme synthase